MLKYGSKMDIQNDNIFIFNNMIIKNLTILLVSNILYVWIIKKVLMEN
jgi:hypothetical protein